MVINFLITFVYDMELSCQFQFLSNEGKYNVLTNLDFYYSLVGCRLSDIWEYTFHQLCIVWMWLYVIGGNIVTQRRRNYALLFFKYINVIL